MALDSVVNLRASIQSWLMDRTDLAPQCDDFIALCEGDINRVLRTREMEKTEDLTPTDGVCTIPTDFLEFRSVRTAVQYGGSLSLVTPDYADERYFPNFAGTPKHFTIDGANLTIFPYASTTVRLRYYRIIPALTDSNTSNWLLVKYPNAYLAGCLKYAGAFIGDDGGAAAAAMYGAMFNSTMEALNVEDKRSRWARGGVTLSGPTP